MQRWKSGAALGVLLVVVTLVAVIAVVANLDSNDRVATQTVGTSVAKLVADEIPDPPAGQFFLRGYERPTLEDLGDLSLDPAEDPMEIVRRNSAAATDISAEADDTVSAAEAARQPLVGVPIISLQTGPSMTYLIQRDRGVEIEKALCDAVANAHTNRLLFQSDGSLGSDPKPNILCNKNGAIVANDWLPRRERSITKDDWRLLWSTIAASGADRFGVQWVTSPQAITMDKLAGNMLGTNSTEENRAPMKQIFVDAGWLELTAPSIIGYTAEGPSGVRVFAVFATDDEAKRSRANFAKVLPTEDFYTRQPMAGGDVTVSRTGRVLAFHCPNLRFSGGVVFSGLFPIFFVAT